jgi:orotidine-5'-phosphate decarboxylase
LKNKIILALDVDTLDEARNFVNKLYPEIKIFKVGPRLFTACGPKVIELIRKKQAEVFLDLKFLDIPNTVAHAVRAAVRLKVKMLTLHISGGQEMIKAAVGAARDEARASGIKRPLLLGVTVLTSQKSSSSKVLKLARLGLTWGLDGIVCSVQEAACLRKKIKSKFLLVTPGIRPKNATGDDQKRTATAQEALACGSDFLVIGRPILKAQDPLKAVKQLT